MSEIAGICETREQQSLMLYLETCAVDHGGRVDGRRMNADDFELVKSLEARGLLRFGRLLSRYIKKMTGTFHFTNWVELTDMGWSEAARLRKERGLRNVLAKEYRTESQHPSVVNP